MDKKYFIYYKGYMEDFLSEKERDEKLQLILDNEGDFIVANDLEITIGIITTEYVVSECGYDVEGDEDSSNGETPCYIEEVDYWD
jgi:ApbE superfamily uncharacterized protein (UPF0280 family)